MRHSERIAPVYAWAMSDSETVPNHLKVEVDELRKRIELRVNIKPRDPATYGFWMLQLLKQAYHLRWLYESDKELLPCKGRLARLRGALRELKPLGPSDELELDCHTEMTGLLSTFRQACEREIDYINYPFQMLVLSAIAELYPFLSARPVSKNRHSTFMKLAGEVNCFVMDDNQILNPEESMAYYADKHGFEIDRYLEMHQRLSL